MFNNLEEEYDFKNIRSARPNDTDTDVGYKTKSDVRKGPMAFGPCLKVFARIANTDSIGSRTSRKANAQIPAT